MKKTLFVTMLAAALMGGQVFAAIPTQIEGVTKSEDDQLYGVYRESGDATGGVVRIYADDAGTDYSNYRIYGGYSSNGAASGNKIVMTGGEVYRIIGGENASWDSADSGNVIIIAGGKAREVIGSNSVDSNSNQIHLVGVGYKGQVKGESVVGSEIQVDYIITCGNQTGNNDALSIYGTGITCSSGSIGNSSAQFLNFHIVDGQADAPATPMITAGYVELTDFTPWGAGADDEHPGSLCIYGDSVTDWSAFSGKSITLMQATWSEIQVGWDGTIDDVQIKSADGAVLATCSLGLANEGMSLVATFASTPIPEPTTGTLSLLALAALAARRRRK